MPTGPTDTIFEREDDEETYGDGDENAHRDRARSLEDLDLSGDEMADLHKEGSDAAAKRTLDPNMLNELLLVCSNLGVMTETEDGGTMFTRGEDCEEWVHDLQRAIRRDHATYRLVGKTLGRWKILQKKLLPLLINHQNDWSLVFSILKVLVMLTMKPTNESDNIAIQLSYLRGYKHAFLQHGVIQVLMAILVEPLSREGSSRTSQDYLNMELVLTLFRNLLAIPNADSRVLTSSTNYLSRLQEDLICILHDENVFDMLLLFAEDIEAAENREWNLLVMEMLDLVVQTTTPKQLVASIASSTSDDKVVVAPVVVATTSTTTTPSLLTQLHQQHKTTYNRHSNFGGMLVLNGVMGRKTVVTDFSKTGDQVIPQAHRKPPRQQARKRHGMNDISEVFGSNTTCAVDGASALGTTLRYVCDSLLSKCYTSLTTSLKNEFRRGSAKLLPNDRLLYFHLIWFLTAYHRAKGPHLSKLHTHAVLAYEAKKETDGLDASLAVEAPPPMVSYDQKAILSTLDMFSFNFVLQSIESFAEVKNHHAMMLAVKLLAEMIAMLTDLSTSDDIRLQRIGHSLQHKLFYERDFLDRLPILIKSWIPTAFNFEYATNVVTLTHLVLKMLESQGDHLKVLQKRRHGQAKKPKSKDDENESEEETDRLIEQEMRRKEVQFDSKKYFGSMVTHETIQLYCYVLHQYKTNTAKVNHYVYAYFFRVQQFHAIEDGTMEPMLFNIHVLLVFNKMLQDTATTGRSQTFRPFVEFIRTIIRNFFALADTNHLVFVESLIRHSYAPRTCAQIQNKYKSMAMGSKDAVSVGQDDNNDNKELRKYLPGNFDLDGEAEFDGGVASFGVVAPASSSADVALAGASAPSTKSSKNAVRKKRDNTKMWSKVEDRYLGKMYHKYRHLPSVFEVISYEDMFQDRDRTPDQIERRVKHLKLHKLHEYDVSSDSDDKQADKPWDKGDDSSDDGGNTSGKPSVERGATTQGTPIERPVVRSRRRRRLVRHAASNDKDESNSDDDLAMLTGASSSKAANVPANEKQKTDGGEEGDADVPSGTTLSPFLKQKSTTRFIRTNHDSDDDDDDLDELMAASRRAQVLSEEGVPPDSPKRRRGSDDDVADDFSSSKRRRPHDESEPSTADVGSTTHDQPMDDEQSEVRGAIEQSEDYTFDQSIDM